MKLQEILRNYLEVNPTLESQEAKELYSEVKAMIEEALEADPDISFEQAVNELQTSDDWVDHMDLEDILTPIQIAEFVTFENSNGVAHHLAINQPLEATALLEELLYWRGLGRI